MKTQTTHSPLPWRVDTWFLGEKKYPQIVIIAPRSADCVAYVKDTGWIDGEGSEQAEANAELIVRSVNLMADAVDLARMALREMERFYADQPHEAFHDNPLAQKARAFLSRIGDPAEGPKSP